MAETLYEVLGLLPSATPGELRSAYRLLVRRYHPDVSEAPKEVAERQFIAVQEAYEVLRDPLKRVLYDGALAAHLPSAPLGHTDRKPVSSSNLRSVGYNGPAMVLEVEFRNGSVYRYFAVPLATYEGLVRAESKGRYFNQNILPRFPYQRIN